MLLLNPEVRLSCFLFVCFAVLLIKGSRCCCVYFMFYINQAMDLFAFLFSWHFYLVNNTNYLSSIYLSIKKNIFAVVKIFN